MYDIGVFKHGPVLLTEGKRTVELYANNGRIDFHWFMQDEDKQLDAVTCQNVI